MSAEKGAPPAQRMRPREEKEAWRGERAAAHFFGKENATICTNLQEMLFYIYYLMVRSQ